MRHKWTPAEEEILYANRHQTSQNVKTMFFANDRTISVQSISDKTYRVTSQREHTNHGKLWTVADLSYFATHLSAPNEQTSLALHRGEKELNQVRWDLKRILLDRYVKHWTVEEQRNFRTLLDSVNRIELKRLTKPTHVILEFSELQQQFHYNRGTVPEKTSGWRTLMICRNDHEATAFTDFLTIHFKMNKKKKEIITFDEANFVVKNLQKFISF